jgi:hypothetical protein
MLRLRLQAAVARYIWIQPIVAGWECMMQEIVVQASPSSLCEASQHLFAQQEGAEVLRLRLQVQQLDTVQCGRAWCRRY